MRVTSALWVSALIRRCDGSGLAATMVRRGSHEAGTIFIVIDRLDGNADLYGPAPQASFEEVGPSDRKFQRIAECAGSAEISERLNREARFDPDLWIVEIEDREGRVPFDLA